MCQHPDVRDSVIRHESARAVHQAVAGCHLSLSSHRTDTTGAAHDGVTVRHPIAQPSSISPVGITYSFQQLQASGRLREGGVLDLSAPALSPAQFDALVDRVAQRVSARLGVARKFSTVAAVVPPPPPPPLPRQCTSVPVHVCAVPTNTPHSPVHVALSCSSATSTSKSAPLHFTTKLAPAAAASAVAPAMPQLGKPTDIPQPEVSTHIIAAPSAHSHSLPVALPATASPASRVTLAAEPLSGSHHGSHTAPTVQQPATPVALPQRCKPLIVPSWHQSKRGIPLAQAIEQCNALGLRVGLQLTDVLGHDASCV
jgi:hypothetical protein